MMQLGAKCGCGGGQAPEGTGKGQSCSQVVLWPAVSYYILGVPRKLHP